MLDVVRRGRIPYRDPERFFLVLGLLLPGRISIGKAAESLDLRVDELLLLLKNLVLTMR